MHATRNRQRALWLLAATLLLAFTAAFVILGWYGSAEWDPLRAAESRRAALVGLAAMVLLFVGHGMTQHRRLARLQDELHHAALREAAMRARFEELEALFEASQELAPGMELAGVVELAARRLRHGLDADACVLYLLDGPDGLVPAASAGPDERPRTLPPARPGEGVVGLVHTSGESMVVDTGPLLGQLAVEMNLERSPGAALCVPLRAGARPLGVLAVARFDPANPFVQAHARMVGAFARDLSGAIAGAAAPGAARAA